MPGYIQVDYKYMLDASFLHALIVNFISIFYLRLLHISRPPERKLWPLSPFLFESSQAEIETSPPRSQSKFRDSRICVLPRSNLPPGLHFGVEENHLIG